METFFDSHLRDFGATIILIKGFMGIISAVKQLWNKFKSDTLREDSNYDNFLTMIIFFKANKPTKVVNQKLVDKKRKLPLKCQKKWSIHCMREQNEGVD